MVDWWADEPAPRVGAGSSARQAVTMQGKVVKGGLPRGGDFSVGKILPRPLTAAGSQHPILLGSGAAAPVYQRVLDGPFDIRRERESF